MNAKKKFMKMYKLMPGLMKEQVILNPYGSNPCSIIIVALEVLNDTKLSKELLDQLGFEDD